MNTDEYEVFGIFLDKTMAYNDGLTAVVAVANKIDDWTLGNVSRTP